MAPEIYFGDIRKRKEIESWLKQKQRQGGTHIRVNEQGVIIAQHDGQEEPTVVYRVHELESGYWIGDKVFGSNQVLGELQEAVPGSQVVVRCDK